LSNRIEDWYREYGPALLLFAATLAAGDRGRAQDALHRVFVKLLERPALEIAHPRTYLFRALRNTLLNDARSEAKFASIEPWFEPPPPERDYDAELHLRRALEELPEEQRLVTVLHVWGGLTFAQAAEVLDLNANTVAARYRYALAKLRQSLKENKHA
jgi:RNA polymerase sigma-70 factor, ECF subfamily